VTGRASGLKNSAPITPNETYFPLLLFLHCCPISFLKEIWWDGVKEDVWRQRVGRETG